MSLSILGIGTATPPRQIAQADAAALAASFICGPAPARTLAAIYRQTRIRARGSVLLEEPGDQGYSQTFFAPASQETPSGPSTAARMQRYAAEAGPLAVRAAQQAVSDATVQAAEITHLVTCSCTGFVSPGVDIELIDNLGLKPTVTRTHIGFMGCHAAFNALRVAHAYAQADQACIPLVVCVELCSLHFQYGPRSDLIVSNSIFADGAAAVVGTGAQACLPHGWILRRQWSHVLPDSTAAMGWTIGDHGFEMQLAATVPATVARHLPGIVDRALAEAGLGRGDVALWAVHPGGPRVLAGVAEALDLPADALAASWDVLADHGNMSSGTILFILERLMRGGNRGPCLALAFGPGLTVELALFAPASV